VCVVDPLVGLAVKIGQASATTVVAPLIRQLLGVQERQLVLLEQLGEDVRVLREGSWRRAMHWLEEAAATDETDPERDHRLRLAAEALAEARSLEPAEESPRRAQIAQDLAMTYGLLGRRDDSRRWSLTAYREGVEAMVAHAARVSREYNNPTEMPWGEIFRRARRELLRQDVEIHKLINNTAVDEDEARRQEASPNFMPID